MQIKHNFISTVKSKFISLKSAVKSAWGKLKWRSPFGLVTGIVLTVVFAWANCCKGLGLQKAVLG